MRVSSAAMLTSRARGVCGAVRIGALAVHAEERVCQGACQLTPSGFLSALALPTAASRLPGTSGCACS